MTSPDCLGNLRISCLDWLGNLEIIFPDGLGNVILIGFPHCLEQCNKPFLVGGATHKKKTRKKTRNVILFCV